MALAINQLPAMLHRKSPQLIESRFPLNPKGNIRF
jgi:hypothetical protein